MEITTKGMTTKKIPLINLMSAIYFSNHQKRQLVDFLKKYPYIIYVKSCHECEFRKFASNKTRSISALTLKFSK